MPPVPTLLLPALVDADWLAARLNEARVIDTRRTGDYLNGHVPGACSFPLDALLVERTDQAALERLARASQLALAARGIQPADQVVLVDDADGSGALGALMCELAGVTQVTVLRGGVAQWSNTGRPIENFPAMPAHGRASDWSEIRPRLEFLATFDDVVRASRDQETVLLDCRSQLEHEGILGTPCCARRGAIPGSTHLEWTAFLDMSGSTHVTERVHELADHVGADLDTPIIVTCHAGHRAAISARALRAAGYTDVRVSLGSWHEWAARAAAAGLATT